MTIQRDTRLSFLAVLITMTGACAASGPSDGDRDGFGLGGKADGFSDCLDTEGLVDQARADYSASDSFYEGVAFSDDLVDIVALDDLNADGVGDALVYPGVCYTGANCDAVVYLSKNGCEAQFAGVLGGVSSVSSTDDGAVTNGVRDLSSANTGLCDIYLTRYQFDGSLYVAGDSLSCSCPDAPDYDEGAQPDQCAGVWGDDECADDAALIRDARAQFQTHDSFYNEASFTEDAAYVDPVADLNDDGIADSIVWPGACYSGANCDAAVYLSKDGCADQFAGVLEGIASVDATADGATTNGARDLTSSNNSVCSVALEQYQFNGEIYVKSESVECACPAADGYDPSTEPAQCAGIW